MSEYDASSHAPVRVLVVDDQRLICDGIASLLSLHEGVAVVGTAANGQDAVAQAAVLRPDVVLMDIKMPLMDGIEATRLIRNEHPSCQVLVLTTFDDDAYIIEALEAGAAGYLLKTIPAQELVQAIRAAHSHMYLFDRTLAGKVVAALRDSARLRAAQDLVPPTSANTDIPKELTSRELEVLRLVARGASNREIAVALVITESTVKAHISSLLSRLGLRDRTQAALYARDKGWLW
jgi:DNA-binding NarL/FixJ family response regulator